MEDQSVFMLSASPSPLADGFGGGPHSNDKSAGEGK